MNKLNINHTNPNLSHLQEIDDKPTIGIDLDGVISSTRRQFLKEIEYRYSINLNNGARSVQSKTGKSFGTLIEEIAKDDTSIYQDIKPIRGASEATNKLKEYYNIKIITHRVNSDWLDKPMRKELKKQSIDWLNNHNIYFDEFVYPTPQNKSNVYADVYIDDRKQNIENFVNNDKIGIMYLRPHNLESIPWESWLASTEIDEDIIYISNNEEIQWNTIANSLIEPLSD